MPRAVQVTSGVIVQQDQNKMYPFVLPDQGAAINNIASSARLILQLADAVVGSSTDVANGAATHTSVQTAINYVSSVLGYGKIIVLDSIPFVENISIPTEIFVEGLGHKAYIQGSITFNGNYSLVKFLRHQTVAFAGGTDGNRITDTWMTTGGTVTNSGGAGNYWSITGE